MKLVRIFLAQFTQRDSPRYRAAQCAKAQKVQKVVARKGGKRKK